MRANRLRLLLALGLSLAPLAVHADAIQDADDGVRAARTGNFAQAIEFYTKAINSSDLTPGGQAQAFAYRGFARTALGDIEAARSDFSLAVALDDADFNSNAYAFRGFFELVIGEAKPAAADLNKSAHLSIWPYNAIWLHLARVDAGVPDDDDVSLKQNIANYDTVSWPGPVLEYMAGNVKLEDVRAAAAKGDVRAQTSQGCDADFYLAEFDIAKGDGVAAKPLLQRAVDKCPADSFERIGATAELGRMK